MLVIGTKMIDDCSQRHNQSKGPLSAWLDEAKKAKWKTSQDIKSRYPKASFLSGNTVIFDIKGNTYRLVVEVVYIAETVVITWVGTHADYDKKNKGGGFSL